MTEREEIINHMAYNFYQIRLRHGLPGNDKDDWFKAEEMYEEYEKLHCGVGYDGK